MAAATTRSENAGSPTRRGVALASAVVTGLLVVLAVSCGGSSDSESAPSSARGAELYQANCRVVPWLRPSRHRAGTVAPVDRLRAVASCR